jgi:hypothetical protein
MASRPYRWSVIACFLPTAITGLLLAGPASAQLANGPWPMFRHDVCHTGQSPNPGPRFTSTGPAVGDIKKWTGYDKIRTSPALGPGGKRLYFGMGFDVCSVDTVTMTGSHSHSATYKAEDCYRLRADVSDSSPAVAANGTIYIGDRDNTLTALTIKPDGDLDLKWAYNNGFEGDIWTSPAIAPNGVPAAGTIYFAHDTSRDGVGVLTALLDKPQLATGLPYTVKWKYKIGNAVRQSSPAIDRNGTIYVADLIGYVHAFRDNGEGQPPTHCWLKKLSSAPGITASPVISPDGKTLYIGTTGAVPASGAVPGIPMGLTALDISVANCSGTAPPIKWTFATTSNFEGSGTGGRVDQPPAIAHDGKTLYVPVMNGGNHSLYAVSDAGVKQWRFGPINSASTTGGHPIVGTDGTIYVGMATTLYALSSMGTQIWKYATTNTIDASPLIGPLVAGKAVVYVPGRNHVLHAIAGPPSGSAKPTTCWSGTSTPGNESPIADACATSADCGGADQTVLAGENVTFDGSESSDPGGTLSGLTFTWDFGAGQGGYGPCSASDPTCVRQTHRYTQVNPDLSGYYTATLTVADAQGASDVDSVRIHVNPVSGPTPTFTDNFDRTELGSQWTETAGDLVISQNRLTNTQRGDNIATVVGLSGANQSASGDFTSADNNTGPRVGVVLRYQDAKNHYRIYRSVGGSSQLRIAKLVNGIEYPLKSVIIPNPVVGTAFHIVGSVVGTTLTASTAGVQITVSDTKYASGGVGVLIGTGPLAAHSADNYCAAVGGGGCP